MKKESHRKFKTETFLPNLTLQNDITPNLVLKRKDNYPNFTTGFLIDKFTTTEKSTPITPKYFNSPTPKPIKKRIPHAVFYQLTGNIFLGDFLSTLKSKEQKYTEFKREDYKNTNTSRIIESTGNSRNETGMKIKKDDQMRMSRIHFQNMQSTFEILPYETKTKIKKKNSDFRQQLNERQNLSVGLLKHLKDLKFGDSIHKVKENFTQKLKKCCQKFTNENLMIKGESTFQKYHLPNKGSVIQKLKKKDIPLHFSQSIISNLVNTYNQTMY